MSDIDVLRRRTLKGIALLGGSAAINPAIAATLEGNDSDWETIRAAYPEQAPFLNLNNAGVSPQTLGVQRQAIEAYQFANTNPDYKLWSVLDAQIPVTTEKLARLADCNTSEIALNRNTTEGMCTAIFGMPLSRGDEVLLSNWDYPSMIKAWEQRAQRDGIVVRRVSFDLMDSDDAIVAAFADAITPRTRAIQLTHMIHWSGRVIPVERICRIASDREILTVVDAAQSFAQIPLSFRKIGCDYLATSLHKWMCAPFGSGMLIVKNSRIKQTWPLFAIFEELEGIDKFGKSNLGTYNSATQYAIGAAVDFHNSVGTDRIHARLRELSHYWVDQASDISGFRMHTPMDSPNLGAVTLFSLDGVAVETVEKRLKDEHKINTIKRNPEGLAGIRVSPHIYTRTAELDRFVEALRKIAKPA